MLAKLQSRQTILFDEQLWDGMSWFSRWKWIIFIIFLAVILFIIWLYILNYYHNFISSHLQSIHTQTILLQSLWVPLSFKTWKSWSVEDLNPSFCFLSFLICGHIWIFACWACGVASSLGLVIFIFLRNVSSEYWCWKSVVSYQCFIYHCNIHTC